VLLLEDMRGRHPGRPDHRPDAGPGEAAITAIGRLHGAWWARSTPAGWMRCSILPIPNTERPCKRATRDSWHRALSNFADCYGDYTKKTAERLAPVAARVIKELSLSGARTFCMATIARTTCCSGRVSATTASPPSTGRFPAAAARCTTSPI